MTTKERIKKVTTRYYFTVPIFFVLMFSGIILHSWIIGISGFIGIFVCGHLFAKQVKCPLCQASLYVDSRRNQPMNYCPGCARSLDEEEGSEVES